MEIKAIKYTFRKNLGNYQHEDLTLEAIVLDGEDASVAIKKVIQETKHALGLAVDPIVSTAKFETGEKVFLKDLDKEDSVIIQEVPPVITEAKPKTAPRRKAKPVEEVKEEVVEVQEVVAETIAPVVEKTKVEAKGTKIDRNTVIYDSSVKEHRSRFATYLGTNFPKWKPDKKFGEAVSPAKAKYEEDVRNFSKNLHGKPFEDNKGNMLDTFKSEITTFFGA